MIGPSELRAEVRRRVLVSYRMDPALARALVPEGFTPLLVRGHAVAGVCAIGLRRIRPGSLPAVGPRAWNVAHRIAVEWTEGSRPCSGVWVAERHSSAALPVLAGGRLFPGRLSAARIIVRERDGALGIAARAPGMSLDLEVLAGAEGAWGSGLFDSAEQASAFYEAGAIGWSPRRTGGVEAIELTSTDWRAEAAVIGRIRSSFFDALPEGSVALDSALVMRDLPFRWRRPEIARDSTVPAAAPSVG